MTLAMAAGKIAGKPPSMTDSAFNPPTDAAIATTERAGSQGEARINIGAKFEKV